MRISGENLFYFQINEEFKQVLNLLRKNCFIEYSETAQEVTVEICRETLIKDCDSPGPEVSQFFTL